MAVEPVQVRVVEEPMPFGDVPLAPSVATGRSEAELARAIVQGLPQSAPQLAERVPSLSARLAGVGALMRRGSRSDAGQRKRAA